MERCRKGGEDLTPGIDLPPIDSIAIESAAATSSIVSLLSRYMELYRWLDAYKNKFGSRLEWEEGMAKHNIRGCCNLQWNARSSSMESTRSNGIYDKFAAFGVEIRDGKPVFSWKLDRRYDGERFIINEAGETLVIVDELACNPAGIPGIEIPADLKEKRNNLLGNAEQLRLQLNSPGMRLHMFERNRIKATLASKRAEIKEIDARLEKIKHKQKRRQMLVDNIKGQLSIKVPTDIVEGFDLVIDGAVECIKKKLAYIRASNMPKKPREDMKSVVEKLDDQFAAWDSKKGKI